MQVDLTQLTPNLIYLTPDQGLTEQFLSIPAVYSPNMSDEQWETALENCFKRALITRQFVGGDIAPEDFLDGLSDTGIEPYQAEEAWGNALSFSGKFQSGWK